MIKKLGTKYRIKCIIGAVIFAAIGISGVAAAMGVDEGSIWIGLGSAMFLAFAAWFVSLAIRQSNIRDVLDYCKKKPNPEYEMERIEQFYRSGAAVNGLSISRVTR